MSPDTFAQVDSDVDEFGAYRAVSKAAVASIALGLLSFLYLFSVKLAVFPLAGIVCSIAALVIVRRYPDELTGRVPAFVGMVLSVVLLASGSAVHAVTYATEVPDGFERISFYDLQPDNPKIVLPPNSAKALDGKRVFVKGYVHPAADGNGPVTEFILVPDMKTCCFGGQPKLTDMIEVHLPTTSPITYSRSTRKLAGVLHVDTKVKQVSGMEGGYYTLDAEYVK